MSRARRVVFPHNDAERAGAVAARRSRRGPEIRGGRIAIQHGWRSCTAGRIRRAVPGRWRGADCRRSACRRDLRRTRRAIEEPAGDAFISINTAGKAHGRQRGIRGRAGRWAIEYLIQRARPFIFSTAPPPAVAAALEASLELIVNEPERRERLLARARYLRRSGWGSRRGFADYPDHYW